MPKHLKDVENRVHEGCGFYRRDIRRVLLPGHIVLPTETFLEFASYIIRGGSHGWKGECPHPAQVERIIKEISAVNIDSLTDPAAPATKKESGSEKTESRKSSKLLTDENFYAMFKEKFANWRPVPADMARLPEPVRKFIAALQTKMDPESKTLETETLRDQNQKLQKQLNEHRQKLLTRDKEKTGLSEYIDSIEAKLDIAERMGESQDRKMREMEEKLRAAQEEAQHQKEKQAYLDKQLTTLQEEHNKTKEVLKSTTDNLRTAEELLEQSEEARVRQVERFRGHADERPEAPQESADPEEGRGPETAEAEVPGPVTSEEELDQ